MANISLIGLPSTDRVPGYSLEINFNQGLSSAGAGVRCPIIIAPITTAGTYTVNTVYQVRNDSDVVTGSGAGSPLHRMVRKFLQANRTAKLYVLPYAASSGVGVASADGYFTLAGTATSSGVLGVTICGDESTASIVTGDTATVLGDKIVASINMKSWLPVTAANVAGKVTLTAKIAGASQNSIIRFRVAKQLGAGITYSASGSTLGTGYGTVGADGATTEVANFTSALAAIDSARYYYVVHSLNTAAALALVQSHIAAKSQADAGMRSVSITAYTGDLTSAKALATARNYERMQIGWQPNADNTPGEIAANLAAVRQKYEEVDSSCNVAAKAMNDWLILGVASESDFISRTDLNDALSNGLTPISSNTVGVSRIVMSLTTRSKYGNTNDFRSDSTHIVSTADELGDEIIAKQETTFGGYKLADDKRLANGMVDPAQSYKKGVLTPSQYIRFLAPILRSYEDQSKIVNVDATLAGLAVNIDPLNTGRLETGFDVQVVYLCRQITSRVNEISQG